MSTTSFHAGLRKDEFAQLLETRFDFLQPADPHTVAEIDASLGRYPTRGQPKNINALKLFRQADIELERGVTQETAIERAMELLPDVKPHHRRTKKITIRTDRDPDHDKEILLAEYKRYRALIAAGLDPAIPYSIGNFFEFILTRQWQRAAAVFTKANKERRLKFCARLNAIGSEKSNNVT